MQRFKKKRLGFIVLVVLALLGCGAFMLGTGHDVHADEENPTAHGEASQAMPVDAEIVMPRVLQVWENYSGRVVAVDRADIRPQVSGRIMDILFKDGARVEKGDTLIVIDPRPYQAALNQAQAALETTKAQAGLAEKEYQRATSLIKTNAISQGLMDERRNARASAAAAVRGAEAAVDSAQINLDYANVKAPISGIVSRAEITEGNLVQAGAGAPLLTTIVANERVYVDFEVDEQTYIRTIRNSKDKNQNTNLMKIPVHVTLSADGSVYKGYVSSFDNRINVASGTMRARAIFDNSDGVLLPGMSVSVALGSSDVERITVSERAIGTDQDRKFVYIIENGVSTYRQVEIGASIDGQRIVLSGLNGGENVITDGIVRIRPGMPVIAKSDMAKENTAEHAQESEGQ